MYNGILKNNKSENPKAPKLKGWVTIDNKRYWISAWFKESGKGKLEGVPHWSLEFKPQDVNHVGGMPMGKNINIGTVNAGAHPSTQPVEDNIPY